MVADAESHHLCYGHKNTVVVVSSFVHFVLAAVFPTLQLGAACALM